MNSEINDQFNILYESGKDALERGQYRLSVENLERAIDLVPNTSKIGGEASIWLVTAYQGVGNLDASIALCRQLTNHPNPLIRQQGKRLLYILEAPRLKRPPEWMSQIPTFEAEATESNYVPAKPKSRQSVEKKYKIEPVDLSQVNTKDNGFIGVALGVIILILGGLFWFS